MNVSNESLVEVGNKPSGWPDQYLRTEYWECVDRHGPEYCNKFGAYIHQGELFVRECQEKTGRLL